jgi:hypothetical protein
VLALDRCLLFGARPQLFLVITRCGDPDTYDTSDQNREV